MRLAVVGAGYAGLVCAAGWARLGNVVTCIERDGHKAELVNSGRPLTREPGLAEEVGRQVSVGRLAATADFDAVKEAEVVFITVGTPAGPDGSQDLAQVRDCAEALSRRIEGEPVIVMRSTVLPGTTESLLGPKLGESGAAFGLAMMPEFLREGTALSDFLHPDRVIIGTDGAGRTRGVLEELCSPFRCLKLWTDIKTAEMTKYASNILLASRLGVVNELAAACMETGLDIDEVLLGAAMDRRIGREFLRAGPGFGGSCLPKDVSAMQRFMERKGVHPAIIRSLCESNRRQQELPVSVLGRMMRLEGAVVAVLGLSFKAGTDDVRGSPAATIIRMLLEAKARVRAYDPAGNEGMRMLFPDVGYAGSFESCLSGADAVIIATPWPEFGRKPAEYASLAPGTKVVDCWRMLDMAGAKSAGLEYRAIGKGGP